MGWNSNKRKEEHQRLLKEDAAFRQRYEEELTKLSGRKHNYLKDFLVFVAGMLLLAIIAGTIFLTDQHHATEDAQAIAQVAQQESGVSSGVRVTKTTEGHLVFTPASASPASSSTGEDSDANADQAAATNDSASLSKTGIIFYPGAKVDFVAYAPLMQKLASQQVTCVLLNVPFNLAFFGADAAAGAMSQLPEVERWYIAGHSLGGVVGSTFALNHQDSVDGVIFLASYPSDSLSNTSLRALSICGSADGVMNQESYQAAQKLMPKDFQELVIEGGNHAQFGSYGTQDKDGQATITPDDQQQQTANAIVKFLSE